MGRGRHKQSKTIDDRVNISDNGFDNKFKTNNTKETKKQYIKRRLPQYMIDLELQINNYLCNIDPNAENMISCYALINKLRSEGKELNCIESFRCYYLFCLILNDYFFYRNINSSDHFRSKKEFFSDVDLIYNKLFESKPSFDLLNQTVVQLNDFGKRQISLREALNGNDADETYYIFNKYNLRKNSKHIVGMRSFISYLEFEHLMEENEYSKAREVAEKHIDSIALIKDCYSEGKRLDDNDNLLDYLSFDLELLTGDAFDCEDLLETAYEKIKSDQFKERVEPTINVLCKYYMTLEEGDYKDYIQYLIRVLPRTKDSNALFEKLAGIQIYEYLQKQSKLGYDTEDKIESTLNEVEKLTDNSYRKGIFDNLEYKYRYINFDNLDEQTIFFVGNGDYIYEVYRNFGDQDGADFAPPVIEWSKAVENEFKIKLLGPILENGIIVEKLDNRGVWIDQKSTLGSAGKLLQQSNFLYDDLYKKMYKDVNVGFFKSLFSNIQSLVEYRNKAAHSSHEILSINEAKACRDLVLKSQKILEFMSKLPMRIN